jgi:hypothetical protein
MFDQISAYLHTAQQSTEFPLWAKVTALLIVLASAIAISRTGKK